MFNWFKRQDYKEQTNATDDMMLENENPPETDKESDVIVEAVRDRKTGEWYDPVVGFDKLMNKPETMALFKRMKDR